MIPELKKVEEGLALMVQLKEVQSTPSLDKYLLSTQKLVGAAAKDLKDSQTDFQGLCEYFGEEALDPESLFGLIISFLRGIQTAAGIAQAKAKRKARLQKQT